LHPGLCHLALQRARQHRLWPGFPPGENYRDWGGKDVQDLLTGVDHVISLGVADPDRLGITGWSYGGYLTAATITQTGRFKAAAIGAGW